LRLKIKGFWPGCKVGPKALMGSGLCRGYVFGQSISHS
jgi:hypothetical protein